MTNPALSALMQRRADIAGEIIELEAKTEAKRVDLVHLDCSIRMFDPEIDPEGIPSRQRFPRRSQYFAHGEVTRIIYNVLRSADEPASASVIVEAAMRQKGFDPLNDRNLRKDFYQKFLVQLNAMRRTGTVEAVGRSKGVKWRLSLPSISLSGYARVAGARGLIGGV
jgi:hypothetical protein